MIPHPPRILFYRKTPTAKNAVGVDSFSAPLVKGGVAGVEVLGIEVVLGDAEGVTKPLVMHDLPLPQKLDGLADVGIVAEAEDVVVGHAGLLLCYYHVFATFLLLVKTAKSLDL